MTFRKVCDIPLPVKEGGAIECAASFLSKIVETIRQ